MLLSLLFHVDADFFELHVNLSESHFNGLANDWWHLTRENWSIRVLRGSCRKFGDRSLECKTKNSTSTFLCLTRNRGQSPRGGGFFVSPPQRGKRQETRGQSPSFSKGTKRGQRGHRRPIHQRSDEGNNEKPGTVPARWGFFCFPAPKGQNEIAQGKAKRRPGYIGAWISAPLSSAPSGRESISTFETTGRCPGLSPCAPLGQKARNRGQETGDSPRAVGVNEVNNVRRQSRQHGRFSQHCPKISNSARVDQKPGTVPARWGVKGRVNRSGLAHCFPSILVRMR